MPRRGFPPEMFIDVSGVFFMGYFYGYVFRKE